MDGQPLLLATMPPDARRRWLALSVALLLAAAFIAALPFRNMPLPRVDNFIPIIDTILFIIDGITAVLLFAQFSVLRSRALLMLAGGYLFTSLTIVPHALTFPGAFAPNGLLDAGLQSTAWLYVFWHMGLPSAVIGYALLRHLDDKAPLAHSSVRPAALACVLAAIVLAWAAAALATIGANLLPPIMADQTHAKFPWHFVPPVALSIVAIGLLGVRRRSVLDLWLLVALVAWLLDSILLNDAVTRFSLIWYAGRTFGLLAASFVLLIMLSEATVLYARLAVSAAAQKRDQDSRLMTMDAVAASIAHEVKQPLSAIVTNADIGLRWLERKEPDLNRLAAIFKRIDADGHRASDVVGSIRAMFSKQHTDKRLLGLNDLIREALALVRTELEMQRIAIQLRLAEDLPQVVADRVQIQQTILNLITNAIEAMNPIVDRERLLSVKSERYDSSDVLVTVEDSGMGIDQGHLDRIFDAFFTTKSKGTGMGLSLCRSIIQDHGGRLWASPRTPYGTAVCFQLPGETFD